MKDFNMDDYSALKGSNCRDRSPDCRACSRAGSQYGRRPGPGVLLTYIELSRPALQAAYRFL